MKKNKEKQKETKDECFPNFSYSRTTSRIFPMLVYHLYYCVILFFELAYLNEISTIQNLVLFGIINGNYHKDAF